MDIIGILSAFFATFMSAMAYSFIVFKKSKKHDEEEFNPAKLKRTIIIAVLMSIVMAGYSVYTGVTIAEASMWTTSFAGGMVVIIVDQIASYLCAVQLPTPPEEKPKKKKDKDDDEPEEKKDEPKKEPVVVESDAKPIDPKKDTTEDEVKFIKTVERTDKDKKPQK